MTTANASLKFDNTSDANFRSWGSGIAALWPTGSFWTQAADTGQINWSTVTAPATSTFGGYEIWKSNDALSSTFPIYMKVEYGTNANATKGPQIRFSFGTSTDGAGTLTGNIIGTFVHNPNVAGQGATLYNFYCSGGAGYFTMFLWNTSSVSIGGAIAIERSLDSSGSYTSTYATVFECFVSSVINQQTLFKVGSGTITAALSNLCTFLLLGSSVGLGSFAAAFPMFPYLGYPDNPATAVAAMKTGDQTEGATFTLTLYGTSHTYLYSKVSNLSIGTTHTNFGVGLRYE